MKSEVIENRYFIECDCCSPSHFLLFDIYIDKENKEFNDIYVTICSGYERSLFKRIIFSIKYIFKKEAYLYTDGVVISKKNIQQLEEVINKIKEMNND